MLNITIITPTYDKHEYIQQTANSVFNQTRDDWEWWIILDYPTQDTKDIVEWIRVQKPEQVKIFGDKTKGLLSREDRFRDPLTRMPAYRPALFMKRYFPLVETKYFMWLSDDDLLDTTALKLLAGALDANPTWDVVHGSCDIIEEVLNGQFFYVDSIGAADQGLGTGINPHCNIDGGQIMQTKRSFDALGSWGDNMVAPDELSHCDGFYMEELAKHFTFHYVGQRVLRHRRTKKSTFIKPYWAHQQIQTESDARYYKELKRSQEREDSNSCNTSY